MQQQIKIFPAYAEKDSCTNISETDFCKEYFLVMRKQAMVLIERLESVEQCAALFKSLYNIPVQTILDEEPKKCGMALDTALKYFENLIKAVEIYILELNYFVMFCVNNLSSAFLWRCSNMIC